MQLQDYIFYYHSNYLKNYKEIMRAQRARNALVLILIELSTDIYPEPKFRRPLLNIKSAPILRSKILNFFYK